MVTAVSPFCQYSDLVVTVRVTLQEERPMEAPSAVRVAMSTETMILMICFLVIVGVCLGLTKIVAGGLFGRRLGRCHPVVVVR